eukprot:Hpha_TRINITY_DN13967_c0_g1::TRINITY_DN13967_c0_g1_i2::g.35390::m.35390
MTQLIQSSTQPSLFVHPYSHRRRRRCAAVGPRRCTRAQTPDDIERNILPGSPPGQKWHRVFQKMSFLFSFPPLYLFFFISSAAQEKKRREKNSETKKLQTLHFRKEKKKRSTKKRKRQMTCMNTKKSPTHLAALPPLPLRSLLETLFPSNRILPSPSVPQPQTREGRWWGGWRQTKFSRGLQKRRNAHLQCKGHRGREEKRRGKKRVHQPRKKRREILIHCTATSHCGFLLFSFFFANFSFRFCPHGFHPSLPCTLSFGSLVPLFFSRHGPLRLLFRPAPTLRVVLNRGGGVAHFSVSLIGRRLDKKLAK